MDEKPACANCKNLEVVVVDLEYGEYFCQRCADQYGPEDWDRPVWL